MLVLLRIINDQITKLSGVFRGARVTLKRYVKELLAALLRRPSTSSHVMTKINYFYSVGTLGRRNA